MNVRDLTLAVYSLIVLAGLALHVAGMRKPERIPHAGRVLGGLTSTPTGRWLALFLWLWLGWHLFVR
jgi:hypothetical protein